MASSSDSITYSIKLLADTAAAAQAAGVMSKTNEEIMAQLEAAKTRMLGLQETARALGPAWEEAFNTAVVEEFAKAIAEIEDPALAAANAKAREDGLLRAAGAANNLAKKMGEVKDGFDGALLGAETFGKALDLGPAFDAIIASIGAVADAWRKTMDDAKKYKDALEHGTNITVNADLSSDKLKAKLADAEKDLDTMWKTVGAHGMEQMSKGINPYGNADTFKNFNTLNKKINDLRAATIEAQNDEAKLYRIQKTGSEEQAERARVEFENRRKIAAAQDARDSKKNSGSDSSIEEDALKHAYEEADLNIKAVDAKYAKKAADKAAEEQSKQSAKTEKDRAKAAEETAKVLEENEVRRLKLAGDNAGAEKYKIEAQFKQKIADAEKSGDASHVAALKEALDLELKIADAKQKAQSPWKASQGGHLLTRTGALPASPQPTDASSALAEGGRGLPDRLLREGTFGGLYAARKPGPPGAFDAGNPQTGFRSWNNPAAPPTGAAQPQPRGGSAFDPVYGPQQGGSQGGSGITEKADQIGGNTKDLSKGANQTTDAVDKMASAVSDMTTAVTAALEKQRAQLDKVTADVSRLSSQVKNSRSA